MTTEEQDKVCGILRAYIQEWGADQVVIQCPIHWKEFSEGVGGNVKFEFITNDEVIIRVIDNCCYTHKVDI